MNYGLIVAAGKSTRMGKNVDKAFLSLENKPVLAYALEAYQNCPSIDAIIMVVRKDRVDATKGLVRLYGGSKVEAVIAGGAQRQDSVQRGLDAMPEDVRIVSVHDGARPCVTPDLIEETIKVAKRSGAAVAAARVTDTIKHVERGTTVSHTVDRSKLWAVQTPQTFKLDLLKRAFAAVVEQKAKVTDESAAVELLGEPVRLVAASITNLKITAPEDLPLAAACLRA
jgi:2-C-methyl-D-erythritol 4-phosphate cytidylyltransferase